MSITKDIQKIIETRIKKAAAAAGIKRKVTWYVLEMPKSDLRKSTTDTKQADLVFKDLKSNLPKLGKGIRLSVPQLREVKAGKLDLANLGREGYYYGGGFSSLVIITRSARTLSARWSKLVGLVNLGSVKKPQTQTIGPTSNTRARQDVEALGSEFPAAKQAADLAILELDKIQSLNVKVAKYKMETKYNRQPKKGILEVSSKVIFGFPNLGNSRKQSAEEREVLKSLKGIIFGKEDSVARKLDKDIDASLKAIFLSKKPSSAAKEVNRAAGSLFANRTAKKYKGGISKAVGEKVGSKLSLKRIMYLMNVKMHKYMKEVMGDSEDSPHFGPLRYQTGRFAKSVKVENLSLSSTAKTLYVDYDYMEKPYGVFEGHRASRRPHNLTRDAIREMLKDDARMRESLGTNRIALRR